MHGERDRKRGREIERERERRGEEREGGGRPYAVFMSKAHSSASDGLRVYGDTSTIRNSLPLGPYGRLMPRALWWSWGVGRFS